MKDINKQRTILHACKGIRAYLKDNGYALNGLTNSMAITLYATLKYKENIEPLKTNSYNWLYDKIKSGKYKGKSIPLAKPVKKKADKQPVKPKRYELDVPKDYQSFLKSPYWIKVRNMVKNRDDNKCTMCSSKTKLHVHHMSYQHHLNEMNHLDDLITLCSFCHKKVHGL